MNRNALAFAALVSVILVPAQCRAELKAGDPAPALTVSKWVKGEPVAKLEKGKVYVLEFWATWCGPCVAAIPHVSELQKEHKDVVFIGQNCWERSIEKVEPFVKQMDDKMNYRVAMDDLTGAPRGKMAEAWLAAAGQNGIPCSFVVDKNLTIAWIGHPMELDRVVKGVVAGTFDPKKEAEAAAAKQTAMDEFEQSFGEAMQAKDFDKAIKAIDKFATVAPDVAPQLNMQKFMLLLEKKDNAAAYKLGAELVEKNKTKAELLNGIAWTLVDPAKPVEKPDLALAEKAALAANAATGGKEAAILDTVARVYKTKGDLAKAIEFQTKAVDNAPDEEAKAQLKKTLDEFKAEKK